MTVNEVEVWGGDACSICEAWFNQIVAAGYPAVHKNFDALEEEDSLKRADILGAYSFEEAFPVMFYGGRVYTPKEFVTETGIAPPAV